MVASIANRFILEPHCCSPIHENIIGSDYLPGLWIGDVQFCKSLINAFQPVFGVLHHRLRHLLPKSIEEVSEIKEGLPVMWSVRSGVRRPIREVEIRVDNIVIIEEYGIAVQQ